ncbi:hypothetical protein K6119_12825 [Paracrocinitomix mangrovi]|uniref:hypothetical protein n=1 Tax=Paracrocinitomix mangrovi TaxID=2862509 RepID=UPI001C8D393D|nr:hypothetical protein [Paracrocinitomix mangrovi]UKN00614.1 hypothetical protein K6119_12825 [Paracrocinitomix mangrovi]
MNRLIRQLGISEDFTLKTIIKVEELMNHDMIYIYHHIAVGSVLDLVPAGSNVIGDPRYEVKYGQFKLGYITLKGLVKSIFEKEECLQAEVASVGKQKFMPIKELDIQLGAKTIRKVG